MDVCACESIYVLLYVCICVCVCVCVCMCVRPSKCVHRYKRRNLNLNLFIHSRYLYCAPSRNLHSSALSPVTAKEIRFKKLAEGGHIVAGHAASAREFIPSGGANRIIILVKHSTYIRL